MDCLWGFCFFQLPLHGSADNDSMTVESMETPKSKKQFVEDVDLTSQSFLECLHNCSFVHTIDFGRLLCSFDTITSNC